MVIIRNVFTSKSARILFIKYYIIGKMLFLSVFLILKISFVKIYISSRKVRISDRILINLRRAGETGSAPTYKQTRYIFIPPRGMGRFHAVRCLRFSTISRQHPVGVLVDKQMRAGARGGPAVPPGDKQA